MQTCWCQTQMSFPGCYAQQSIHAVEYVSNIPCCAIVTLYVLGTNWYIPVCTQYVLWYSCDEQACARNCTGSVWSVGSVTGCVGQVYGGAQVLEYCPFPQIKYLLINWYVYSVHTVCTVFTKILQMMLFYVVCLWERILCVCGMYAMVLQH